MSVKCRYLFLGHHKCASTYVKSVLNDLARMLRRTVGECNTSDDLESLGDFRSDFFFLLNSDSNIARRSIDNFSSLKSLHVVRDPRDIVVSAYFSHLHSHPTDQWPELIPHKERLKSLSKHAGLLEEMKFCEDFFANMNSWEFTDTENILHVKMEDLISSPYERWIEILDHMGVIDTRTSARSFRSRLRRLMLEARDRFPLIKPPVGSILPSTGDALGIVYENRFETKTKGRAVGQEDVHHHYRKGVPGDWKNHFDKDLVNEFKRRYNHLLLKYRYETNENWSSDLLPNSKE